LNDDNKRPINLLSREDFKELTNYYGLSFTTYRELVEFMNNLYDEDTGVLFFRALERMVFEEKIRGKDVSTLTRDIIRIYRTLEQNLHLSQYEISLIFSDIARIMEYNEILRGAEEWRVIRGLVKKNKYEYRDPIEVLEKITKHIINKEPLEQYAFVEDLENIHTFNELEERIKGESEKLKSLKSFLSLVFPRPERT